MEKELKNIEAELEKTKFDTRAAASVWAACKRESVRLKLSGPSTFGMRWHSNSSDSGQADDEHAPEANARDPMIACARKGSLAALNWLCSMHDAKLVVEFEDSVPCWMFYRFAASGLSGAFMPMWLRAKKDGWCLARLAEAVSSWLIGVTESKSESQAPMVYECCGAIAELRRSLGNKWRLPQAPSSLFGTALSSAICHEDDALVVRGVSMAQTLLALESCGRLWQHESQIKGSELFLDKRKDSSIPRSYMEDALTMGNVEAMNLLWAKSHKAPVFKRIGQLEQYCSGPGFDLAKANAMRLLALAERTKIDLALKQKRSNHSAGSSCSKRI